MKTKTCNDCTKNLPLESFHKDSKAKDGLKARCRACSSKTRLREVKAAKEEAARQQAVLTLEQQARTLALKELVALHKREYLRLLDNHRLTLKCDGEPRWIEVS